MRPTDDEDVLICEEDVERTADLIAKGVADEQQKGMALRNIKTGMSVKLSIGLDNLLGQLTRQSALLSKAIEKHNEMLEQSIDADTCSIEDLRDFIDSMQSKQLKILDLYRTTIQGKDLFDNQALSDDEKMVLKLFKSFRSNEEKTKFLTLCKESGIFK